MDQNSLPEDPIGPPVLGQAAPRGAVRAQALTGHHARNDGFGTLSTFTTISARIEDS
ncbi:hypothetical protein ABZ342_13685 [Amycolatopsis sp. NPDC005961]|uniref:hypothetical protein n=1 Tax=Amycolatopsis sp. NPDC005961 TaxID=3156720 RepID=UPI00340F90CF